MQQNLAWSYLNISIYHVAAEVKHTSNQQKQKSTEFLFLKARWKKSSSQHCIEVKITIWGGNYNGGLSSFIKFLNCIANKISETETELFLDILSPASVFSEYKLLISSKTSGFCPLFVYLYMQN